MFRKILIANRGEIACRVAATARRMGIATVAVYSDADRHAQHVQQCDEAVHIGPSPAKDSYLQGARIIEAALQTGAQAIHPGYGFLSENGDFAQACSDAGLVFIGPSPQAMAAMGSKSAAKALMAQAGVPLVPGYHGDQQDTAFLQAQADAMGYPVLIKASAGGGGKGMRSVLHGADFSAALASCQREAQASFGNAHVLIERLVNRPRHIEVQVFGDTHGNVVHLFERDCSVQRRHQKVLEEAPAPGLSMAMREHMGQAAVAAARSVGYVGAGTVEFICEHDIATGGRFYFMEMNTRLQVEHPVTEAITGLDLVEWQLRVAAGEALPLQQHELRLKGHAIEARICAENPQQQFLPSTGPLRVMRTPPASAFAVSPVRIDSGVREGDAISPHYDSMIAKLIVWGEDRDTALQRLDQALGQLHITGLHTNVDFVRRIARTASFSQALLDTALIEREHDALFTGPDLPLDQALAGAVQHLMQAQAARTLALSTATDPWSRTDHWQLHGTRTHRWRLQVDDTAFDVTLHTQAGGNPNAEAHTGPQVHWQDATGTHTVSLGDARCQRLQTHSHPCAQGDDIDVFAPTGHARVRHLNPLAAVAEAQGQGGRLTALMPGKVVALLAAVGQSVEAGQPVAITEAMKMEHTLTAPHAGTVSEWLCAVGDQVAEGTELLRIAPASPSPATPPSAPATP